MTAVTTGYWDASYPPSVLAPDPLAGAGPGSFVLTVPDATVEAGASQRYDTQLESRVAAVVPGVTGTIDMTRADGAALAVTDVQIVMPDFNPGLPDPSIKVTFVKKDNGISGTYGPFDMPASYHGDSDNEVTVKDTVAPGVIDALTTITFPRGGQRVELARADWTLTVTEPESEPAATVEPVEPVEPDDGAEDK